MINGNHHEKSDTKRPIQRGLFDPSPDLVTDPGLALKKSMRDSDREAQARYSMSRDQIIDAMNEMAEQAGVTCNGNARKVTPAIYSKWLSASEKHYIPLRWLPIFCRAVRSNQPLEVYTTFFESVRLVAEEDVKKLKWAEIEIKKRKLTKQARQLSEEIGL